MKEQDYQQLTLFPEDSPASPFPWLESKRGKKTIVSSGRRCSELSESLRRVGYSVRTYLESCELPPGMWSRVWSVKDMTSQSLILKLRLSELRTGGNGSRLWPTARAADWKGCGPAGSKSAEHHLKRGQLSGVVLYPTPTRFDATCGDLKGKEYKEGSRHAMKLIQAVNLFPTVRAHETGNYQYLRGDHSKPVLTLTGVVKMFPTPRAQTATGASHAPNRQGGADLQTVVSDSADGGQLNPTWVEWLMGFPIGWTELDASETR